MKRKKSIVILFGIIMILGVLGWQKEMERVQTQVAAAVIRFHVRANSNTREDQELKLRLRDAVIQGTRELFVNCDTKESAESVILQNSAQIKKIAQEALKKENSTATVKVSYQKERFPLRIYEDYAFPPGDYDALRIDIGRAEGKNWWCVMYPSLCFFDETEQIFHEKNADSLKEVVGQEAYRQLLVGESQRKIKIKWKLYEIFQSL